jgi:hypothetical protein
MSASTYAAIIFFSTLFVLLIAIAIYEMTGRRKFDQAVRNGEFESAEKGYKRHFKNPSTSEGAVRKILWQVINKTPPDEFAKAVKEVLPFIPSHGFEKIAEKAKTLDIAFDSQSRQNFHLGEFCYLADLLSGNIPKETAQSFKKGFEKFTVGILVIPRLLLHEGDNAATVTETKYKEKIGLGCELGSLYASEANIEIVFFLLPNDKLHLDIKMNVLPGKVFTGKYDFHHAFDFNNPEIHNHMNQIGREELSCLLDQIPSLENCRMRDIIIREEKESVEKILNCLADFLFKRNLCGSVERVTFKFSEQLPFFWREADTKYSYFPTNYVKHLFRIHFIKHYLHVNLQFELMGNLLSEEYRQKNKITFGDYVKDFITLSI